MYQCYGLNYDDIILLVDVLVLTSLDYAKESVIDAVIVYSLALYHSCIMRNT